ncbi:hypothetical protein B0O99DRAFT_694771 [Bisporella sp. PMI_857]|nr:hypothetical protein B0O99DRAFT_694771 [Bisporella sp. PMI_857]
MSTPKKSKLAPEVLKPHGITYDSAVYNDDSETLPIHVNIVREGLLDFDSFLIRERTQQALRDTGHSHNDIPDSAFKSGGGIESSELETQSKFIMMAVKISDAVQTLQFNQSLENSWQALLNRTVFEQKSYPVLKRYNILNIESTKQIACVCDGTVKWNEAHSIRDLNKDNPLPSIPTPDIYFGYTIYDSTQYTSYGFAKDNFIRNFTTETLYQLTGKGLCSAVTSGFASYLTDRLKPGNERSAIPGHNLLCFPWAVVELKRFKEGNETAPTTEVYCQAANAGSTALCMLENLAKFAKVKQHNQHIPP